MHFDAKEIGAITMILFAVIDIPGGLPVLVDIQQKTGRLKSEQITLVSGIIMIVFLFIGESILNLIGIDIASFAVAGAFIIFFLALEMILGIKFFKGESPETASIVPIAFPLIAGAGTLTTLLSLRSQYSHLENIIVAILINLVVVYLVLRNTYRIEKLLGIGGINILRKIFGVILLALAVKLFKTNAY
ncbi:MAG TPA: MarC family protein [Chitinophagales bacterium]|nr:MarC family protein [Chitinophagales bacterium]